MRLYRRHHRDRDRRIASSSQANGNRRNSERLARFVVPIDMPPKVISILSVSSTAAATAALRALLARFDSPLVAHHDADFVVGIPSAIQPPSHSPTAIAS
jgi:hypothetical protein